MSSSGAKRIAVARALALNPSLVVLTLPEDEEQEVQQIILTGEMPSPLNPPPGCRFHTRCAEANESCSSEIPVTTSVGPQHWVKCRHYEYFSPRRIVEIHLSNSLP